MTSSRDAGGKVSALSWVDSLLIVRCQFKQVESYLSCPSSQSEIGTRKYYNFKCGSSHGLSQMVEVDEYQNTKSGLCEAELILSRASHFVVTKDQVKQMAICPQHRHKLGKFWRPPRSCQYPSHSGPGKKHCNERHVIGLETAKNIHAVGF